MDLQSYHLHSCIYTKDKAAGSTSSLVYCVSREAEIEPQKEFRQMSETEDFEMEENEERKDGGQGERSKGKRISSGKKEVESRLERKDERVDGRMGLGGRMGIGESMKFSQDTPKKSENNDPQKFETPKKSLGDPLDIQIGSEILSDIKSEQETETTESEDEDFDKKYQNIPVKANIK